MKLTHIAMAGLMAVTAAGATQPAAQPQPNLGNFSVSLTVRDINASKAFYEKLGFSQVAGNVAQRWVVMKNGSTKIGLFQGMFPRNTLTFNPGWDENGRNVDSFEDVRAIQRRLKATGLDTGADISAPSGPAHFMITDPDGNPILFDQHR